MKTTEQIDNRLNEIGAEIRHLRRVRRKAVKSTEDICWQSTADIIRSRRELAQESALNGAFAYAFGGCEPSLIGEAVQEGISTTAEADKVIAEKLSGKILNDAEIDAIVMHTYLLMGIFRAFTLRSTGKLKEAAETVRAKDAV